MERSLPMRSVGLMAGPEEARALLAGGFDPDTSDDLVHRHAGAMEDGRWRSLPTSRHPVIVGPDGRVRNGRHRLLAIIASGCAVPLTVLYLLSDEPPAGPAPGANQVSAIGVSPELARRQAVCLACPRWDAQRQGCTLVEKPCERRARTEKWLLFGDCPEHRWSPIETEH